MNIMKVLYAKATIRQAAKASLLSPNPAVRTFSGRTYEEILKSFRINEKTEAYKTYDRWGRLTSIGRAKKEQDLKERGLPPNATIGEFFESEKKLMQKIAKKIMRDIRARERAIAKK